MEQILFLKESFVLELIQKVPREAIVCCFVLFFFFSSAGNLGVRLLTLCLLTAASVFQRFFQS